MNQNQQPGTPDFTNHPQPARFGEESTVRLPNAPYGSYSGADFPAPAGVPPLNAYSPPTTVVERPRHRAGGLIAAAAIAAILGAGAGIGSYAFLQNDGTVADQRRSRAAPKVRAQLSVRRRGKVSRPWSIAVQSVTAAESVAAW
jgi:hypothetical protein